ncbi:LysM peptidoglycan-binding domain-containing protein [Chryseobacterium indologenes]|uniref:LysM peptidoglycan-binding domain-containing protein n=2 Tax=Chryseobacterium group TaxID=2782232 RepID=A0AAD0YXW9_CHRID|nr:LysM peptidoglycan-binding domain-containing protein [Chryseobacterium indologenes]MBF6646363.1 LysM peptidoglycan-binding domain-containing protein [Chryseobacterium indologenes]MBU3048483.1 LysM peptidoglycan-binding domain-containing protein [Chryseobacterium indologenes]QIX83709.1 LysM peptidoglycan-binding domain-containing protein [Chryseobacterium indologenes]QQQ73340.1 LysM peptidoglycan-binding domain-containing protein [Chryseobacterium indologenes]
MVLGVSAQKSHTVVQGDNPYNIAKKYGMTVDELLKLNPKHKDGKLAIGDVLTIKSDKATAPVAAKAVVAEKVKTTPATSAALGKIVLQPKQTIYGITKQYRISETDLRKLNPELDSHMKIGDEITLPLASIKKYGDSQQVIAAEKPAETVVEKPTTVITTNTVAPVEGETYVIQAKDNYYRITKQFGINQQDLFALNPGLEEKGLKPGETIKIKKSTPATESVVAEPEPVNPKTKVDSGNDRSSSASGNVVAGDDYVTYTVQQGDTVFSIVNRFGVSIDDLIALNPELSHGLKSGMVLKIKKQDPAYVKKNGDALSVVLMLPFGYSTNETQYRGMALDFLTGAKLAIERNAKGGQKLDIKVVDSGNEASFKNSLTQINPENTDLIIGPFFKSNVIDVLDFTKNQKIPVVAPFANTPELYNYSNLIIVETNNQTYADKIVEEVKAVYSDQKIYVVADTKKENANYIKAGLEKTLKNPNVVIVTSPADIQLDQNMMTGQAAPVIAVLANDDMGDAFANKVIALSKEAQGVKAFSMFYAPVFEKKVDDLSQASLVYLMDRKINTDGNFEKEILAAYKSKYCKIPPKYAIVGFDVVNDMLTRENKKGEIFRQMNKVQTQLATKFEFVKSKANGAYVNTGYRVIRLVP